MPLHLTKVAFGNPSVEDLAERLRLRSVGGVAEIATRYLPKRHAEIVGGDGGSLFWIIRHQLVARSRIVGFGEADGGRVAIRLDPELVLVQARRKRAHQGWRYLEPDAAPPDLGGGDAQGLGAMPPALQGALADLALI